MITFEDASIMLYNAAEGTVIEWHKRDAAEAAPDEDDENAGESGNAALAAADRPTLDPDNVQAWQAVISEPGLVYLLDYEPVERSFAISGIIKRTKRCVCFCIKLSSVNLLL